MGRDWVRGVGGGKAEAGLKGGELGWEVSWSPRNLETEALGIQGAGEAVGGKGYGIIQRATQVNVVVLKVLDVEDGRRGPGEVCSRRWDQKSKEGSGLREGPWGGEWGLRQD